MRYPLIAMYAALIALGGCGEKSGAEAPAAHKCASDLECPLGQNCVENVCVEAGADSNNGAVNNGAVNNGANNGNNGANNENNGGAPNNGGNNGVNNGNNGANNGGAPNNGANNGGNNGNNGCEANACGGCGPLQGEPDAACGNCGRWACNGEQGVACVDENPNACGGCEPLMGAAGDACGQCGALECADGALACVEPESCGVTRFIAMGDTGEANEEQYQVAAGAQVRCDRAGGCDGFLMLGDNIYDEGAQGPTDNQFDQKIDLPYADLKQGPPPGEGLPDERARLPIYVALGNHDLGGAGLNDGQVAHYIEYARTHPWFIYPDEWWDVQVGNVHIASIHTNPLAYLGDHYEPQGDMIARMVDTTTARWTLVFGHHPYRSNGRHGNAGSYEGIPGDLFFLGGKFREWIDEYVCNRADFYLSGHDHNRQFLESVPDIPSWPVTLPPSERSRCDTWFAVSGAGAKTTDIEDRDNDMAFASEEIGFMFLEFHHDHVHVEFCDANGDTTWERDLTR